MSAIFQLRKAWGGTDGSPTRSTAIANNELYFYPFATSNSVTYTNYPIGRSADSHSALACENSLYLILTKAPSVSCTNFKFWGPAVVPNTGHVMYVGTSATYKVPTVTSASSHATKSATQYYSISNSLTIPGRVSLVGSATGYFFMQPRLSSVAATGIQEGDTLVYHFGYEET